MSEQFDEFIEGDETQQQQPESSTIRQMREELKRKGEALESSTAEAEAGRDARRKLAFMDAGIDLDTPTGKLFADAYQGDLTTEAVKAKASEYGIIEPPKTETATPEEQAAAEEIVQATVGAPEGGQKPPPDPSFPYQEGRRVYQEMGDREQALAAHFRGKLDQAAERGDKGIVKK